MNAEQKKGIKMQTGGKFYSFIVAKNQLYTIEDKKCIESTVETMLSTDTTEDKPGMLLGKIQSGKTKTFLGVIGCAFDNGYSIVVVLTKGTKVLCRQTVARVKSEFLTFIDKDEVDVYDILDMPSLTKYELKKNIIIVAKKQVNNIDKLLDFFEKNNDVFKLRKALIVDDEADFASIGFKKDKNRDIDINRTAKQLNQLRGIINNCSFLQVTATPYSLYLQPADFIVKGALFKPVRPAFTQLVPINSKYTGGDYYFSEEEGYNKITYGIFRTFKKWK